MPVADSGARNINSLLVQLILPILSRAFVVRTGDGHAPAQIRLSFSDESGIAVEFDEVAGAAP